MSHRQRQGYIKRTLNRLARSVPVGTELEVQYSSDQVYLGVTVRSEDWQRVWPSADIARQIPAGSALWSKLASDQSYLYKLAPVKPSQWDTGYSGISQAIRAKSIGQY